MAKKPRASRSKPNQSESVAVLTSGGDAPGMNAAIRAVVRYGISTGMEIYGVQRGYSGLLEGKIDRMHESSVANIIQRGGTVLKTDRCLPFHKKSVRQEAANLLRRKGIEQLVVIGGDGSFVGAHLLEKETGIRVVGIPGTIDNDIYGTDDTIGFDTAINTALEAIDRIRDTANSHDRLFLIEVMGRDSGFIALNVGIAGGAETILVPEEKVTLSRICSTIERGRRRGKKSSIIVVAEGPKPGLSNRLAKDLIKKGYDPKVCILGHTQRGGTPTAHDRFLATSLGAQAIELLREGKSDRMVGFSNGQISVTPLKDLVGKKKPLPSQLITLARNLAI